MTETVTRIGQFQVGSTVKLGRETLTIASFTISRGMPCPVLNNGMTVCVDDLALVRA